MYDIKGIDSIFKFLGRKFIFLFDEGMREMFFFFFFCDVIK